MNVLKNRKCIIILVPKRTEIYALLMNANSDSILQQSLPLAFEICKTYTPQIALNIWFGKDSSRLKKAKKMTFSMIVYIISLLFQNHQNKMKVFSNETWERWIAMCPFHSNGFLKSIQISINIQTNLLSKLRNIFIGSFY